VGRSARPILYLEGGSDQLIEGWHVYTSSYVKGHGPGLPVSGTGSFPRY
jgi:hypothetical protein